MKYQVLLFYKYINIDNPQEEMQKQRELCQKLDLKCRTIIANEGINATLEGTVENTEKYIEEMKKDPRFADIHFKKSDSNGKAFPKINIKVRPEIVAAKLGNMDVDPNQTTGKYITADELHQLYNSGEEFYIVDMRNDYEHKVGFFEGSVLMPLHNFRELPEKIKEIEHLKHKKVITVCTGGIRCEKASGFLLLNGFDNVYQLHGGMHSYIEKYPNQKFKGKLYVFDGRVVMGFNVDSPEHEIVGKCDKCGSTSDDYTDCAYLHCKGHRHFICCANCKDKEGRAFCSNSCKEKFYAESKEFIRT